MSETCHLCGRAIPNVPIVTPRPYEICERSRCRPEREVLEEQSHKIRRYWSPVYQRYLEKAAGGNA